MTKRELAVRAIGWTLGLGALALVIRRNNVSDALPVITAAGPLIAVALIPYFIQIALDARAWQTLLATLGHRVAWRRLITIRLSTEAVLLTVPGGSVFGESLKPYLLSRTSDVPISHTVASVGIKRSLLALAQSIYLTLALIAGFTVLRDYSHAIVGSPALPFFVAGAAVFLLLAALALGLAFMRGRVAMRVLSGLQRLPSNRLREWLRARQTGFAATDSAFRKLGAGKRHVAHAGALLLAAWLVEAGEAWVLCRLVGIDLPFVYIFAMEASIVFVRNVAFIVPAGLGVQDAGYLAFLAAYGVAAPAATAFAVLKRCKELVWVGAGYLLLFIIDRRPTIVALGGLE